MLFLLVALLLSALVFNQVACIPAMDDFAKVAVVSTMPSTALLQWSYAAGRVPTGTLPVVIFVNQLEPGLVEGGRCLIQRLRSTQAPVGLDLQTCQL
jgi:hypothetical protein